MSSSAATTTTCKQLSRWLLPAMVFLLLAGATLLAWQWQSRIQTEAREYSGIQESAAIASEIRQRLRLHAQFLRSLQAFASTNPRQDVLAWRRFTEETDIASNLSGLSSFAYAPAIPAGDREKFLAYMRTQVDRSSFRIFPETLAGVVAPVVFISPETEELRSVVGFDVLSEPVRRQAIEISIARHEVAMTGPIALVHDTSQRLGFLLVRAIYQQHMPFSTSADRQSAFAGVAVTSYRVDEFFRSTNFGSQNSLALQAFDESLASNSPEAIAPTLIYDSNPDFAFNPASPVFRHEIDFGGRNWILLFHSLQRPESDHAANPTSLILFGGLLGSALLALLVFHLTTHRERAERYAHQVTGELRDHRDHLHEMVAERTTLLDEALASAEAASRAKSEFLANMSHELRTPMHAILAFSQLGDTRAQASGDDKQAQYFQRIEQGATRLLGLINDLLDLSKLQAGGIELTLQPTDMLNLINQAVAQLESLCLARRLKVEIEAHLPCCNLIADRKLIHQVIFNLLSNAIKFSPECGTIGVRLELTELPMGRRIGDDRRQTALAIQIIDGGVGIPENELESIFEKFEQSSATRNGAGGTGLGLAISRSIVSQHRGTIVAANNTGGGACFTVILPINHRGSND